MNKLNEIWKSRTGSDLTEDEAKGMVEFVKMIYENADRNLDEELNKQYRATAVTVAESEEEMKYSSFEGFGVEVYEKGELIRRKTFKKLDEAIEFARDMGSAGYTCKYVTLDEIGRVIDEL